MEINTHAHMMSFGYRCYEGSRHRERAKIEYGFYANLGKTCKEDIQIDFKCHYCEHIWGRVSS